MAKTAYREEGVLNVLVADSIIVQADVVAQLKTATTIASAKTSAEAIAARLLSDEELETVKAAINEATTKDAVAEVIEGLSEDLFSAAIESSTSGSEEEGSEEEKTDSQTTEEDEQNDSLYS